LKEKLAAIELWDRRLDQIFNPGSGDNAVLLPTRALTFAVRPD